METLHLKKGTAVISARQTTNEHKSQMQSSTFALSQHSMPSTSSSSSSFSRTNQFYLHHKRPMIKILSALTPTTPSSSSSSSASKTTMIGSDSLMSGETLNELKRILTKDLTHLFDDVGIDANLYDENVEFTDPLSKYTNFRGYDFNIKMLKNVFRPKYKMWSIEKTGDFELTTRWTMKMYLPSFPFVWNPELTFTGRSIMTLDSKAPHRCVKHVDTWDSIENQEYLSPEAVAEVLKQIFNFAKTPEGLKTPEYKTLRRYRDFEIREYERFMVAETTTTSEKSSGSAKMFDDEAGKAFSRLAGYIFGKNDKEKKMDMTTPVFSSKSQQMQFVVEENSASIVPIDRSVSLKERQSFIVAVASFPGIANETVVNETELNLREAMKREERKDTLKLKPKVGEEFVELAQYNDPFTNPLVRRNEVLIALENSSIDFQII